ncbi:hypothetical protein CDD82_5733 [Ophiocordyceps australis]|uniref:Mitochondrial phosphate carrier protein n=1 Tax=Ophiocordyceps australis TaxID=1399860 RepID=A0A2C5XHU3_9HYPO|nr:hypothetical protein CDD82_5733 [Ophiocordyceps australis]
MSAGLMENSSDSQPDSNFNPLASRNLIQAIADCPVRRRPPATLINDMPSTTMPHPGSKPHQGRPELYGAYSVVEMAKDKASSAAQARTGKIELYSPQYYAACTFGGLMACGLTHTAVTPLDLVKTRRQVDSKLYTSNLQAWRNIYRSQGIRGIFTGWSPTLFGYSAQGAFKYGWYEFFKKQYSDLAGPEAADRYKTGLYLAASASAEFLADIALCPFEAVKVRMQGTMPNPYRGTLQGIKSIRASEGWAGLYKGIYPLWGRQIPYTMMKFASFETIVDMMYRRMPGEKDDYSKAAQTGVSFVGGYLAGILCAIVSHPADVMVSKLNSVRKPGEVFGQAMGRIYKDIGFSGLWNGLPMRIVMIGTLTGLQWMIYLQQDYFKIFMGLPTTGGPAPPRAKEEQQQRMID